jgi:hypothetical protein
VRSQIGRRGHTGQQIRAGCCDSPGADVRIEGMLRRAVTWGDWVVWVDWVLGGGAGSGARLTERGRQSRADTRRWQHPTSAVRAAAAALSCSVRGRGHTVIVCKCNAVGGRGDNGRAPGDGRSAVVCSGRGRPKRRRKRRRKYISRCRASGRAGRRAGRTQRSASNVCSQVQCHHTTTNTACSNLQQSRAAVLQRDLSHYSRAGRMSGAGLFPCHVKLGPCQSVGPVCASELQARGPRGPLSRAPNV